MSYLNGLVVFPTFFSLSLNLAIRSSLSEPESASSLVFADCIELLHLCLQRIYNQSDFGIDHLVMSMYRVFSCVVGGGYLLWPVCSLEKTLSAFALLHSVLQGQTCLLLQVSLDFLLLHSSPQWWIEHLFLVLVLKGLAEKAMAPHSSTFAWKNPMDGGAWLAAVHGVAKSWTQLSDFTYLLT